MANALLLGQAANIGNAQDPGALVRGQMAGQNMAAQRQQMGQQNALFQQQQQDRQRMAQQEQEQQRLQSIRNDYAQFMSLPDDDARAQAWQSGLAQHYGQDPQSDWRPTLMQLTQSPGFLPPEVAERIIQDKFAPKQPEQPYTLSPGSVRYGADNKPIASVPAAEKNPTQPRLVQTADPASPTGFVYTQATDAAGKPAPAPRAQTSGKYSPKELQQARDKLRALGVARQQLANLKAQRDKIKDSFASGPGMGALTPLSESGSNFDAAVDQMRDTITALTRTPGVGAMSDFETRLSQAKLPTRNEFESSRDLKIQGLEDFITNLERGYMDLLEDGQQPAAPAENIEQLVEDLVNKYAD